MRATELGALSRPTCCCYGDDELVGVGTAAGVCGSGLGAEGNMFVAGGGATRIGCGVGDVTARRRGVPRVGADGGSGWLEEGKGKTGARSGSGVGIV